MGAVDIQWLMLPGAAGTSVAPDGLVARAQPPCAAPALEPQRLALGQLVEAAPQPGPARPGTPSTSAMVTQPCSAPGLGPTADGSRASGTGPGTGGGGPSCAG
jgi:hypothetical protein